jgi:hypothetical protein
MSIEAMKQALEALESVCGKGKKCNAAITILRKTIEQQTADKPKWYHGVDVNGCNRFYHHDEVRPAEFNTPLYTHPPKREPLRDEDIKTRTDAQIEATFKRCGGKWNGDQWVIEDADLHPFVRTIEGPELNTLRAISDEYNAWIKHHAAGHSYDDFLTKREAAHGIKGKA